MSYLSEAVETASPMYQPASTSHPPRMFSNSVALYPGPIETRKLIIIPGLGLPQAAAAGSPRVRLLSDASLHQQLEAISEDLVSSIRTPPFPRI